MATINVLCSQLFLLFFISVCSCALRTQQYSNGPINAYSPMPVSGRILSMLRERNAVLYSRPQQQKLSNSDDSYFALMRRLANKENVKYQLSPATVQTSNIIQYLPAQKQSEHDSDGRLCRRLHMC